MRLIHRYTSHVALPRNYDRVLGWVGGPAASYDVDAATYLAIVTGELAGVALD